MATNENWFIFTVWENNQKETEIRLFDLCTSHSVCFKEKKNEYYLSLLWCVQREDVWDKFLRLNFSPTVWQIKQSWRYKISKILGRILHEWYIVFIRVSKSSFVYKNTCLRRRKEKCYIGAFPSAYEVK